MNDMILSLKNITRLFPGVIALNDVSFDIKRGEIHAIVGENGAGKSTLMNILAGVFPPSKGSLIMDGREVSFASPIQSQAAGIAMIHQELSLFNALSITENIFVNHIPRTSGKYLDWKAAKAKAREALKLVGLDYLDESTLIRDISTAQQQLIEIAKALMFEPKIIIMDEPTSALTLEETDRLLGIVRGLREKGITVLYISHKLDEIMSISDSITVLRDGEHISTGPIKDYTMNSMISQMVGRDYNQTDVRDGFIEDYSDQRVIMEVNDCCVGSKVKHASWKLYEGEVLGITGLVGAGRSEMIQGIFGVDRVDRGEIKLDGKVVHIKDSADAIKHGMGLVAQGRKDQCLFLRMSVKENLTTVYLKNMKNKMGFLDLRNQKNIAEEYRKKLNVKTPSLDQKIVNLSGGNQQKAIIARWLMNQPRILFLDEPTLGIDIGAKEEIYHIINDLVKQGISVVLVSSEMQEILSLCDRVIVMSEGKIMGEMLHKDACEKKIMAWAAGIVDE